MDNFLKVRLRAVNASLGFNRSYMIMMGRDLFQQWYVTIVFGRYNSWGTSKTQTLGSLEEAVRFIHQKLKRRLSSTKRIGCSYQLVSFDGVDDILASVNKELLTKFAWFERLR